MTAIAAATTTSDVAAVRRLAARLFVLLALAAILFAVSALVAVYARAGNLTVLWPTNALAVAVLLRGPQDRGWRAGVAAAHLAAVFALLVVAEAPLWVSAWLAAGNAFEAVAAFLLLQRVGVGDPARDPVRSTMLFVPVVGFVCAVTAAVCLPAALALGDDPASSVLFSFWWQDLFGMGMIVPLAMSLTAERSAFLRSRREAGLFAVTMAGVCAVAFAAGQQPGSPISALVLPVQIFAAVRFGMLGTTAALFGTTVCALTPLLIRAGGAADAPGLAEDVLQMEVRLSIVFVCLMAVSSVIRQRDAFGCELQRRRAEAEAAELEKSRLVRDLSHEMRTPLNAVVGFSDALLRDMAGPLNDRQRELLRTVSDAARQLHGLADDMSDVAGAEAGRADLSMEALDLHHLARETVRKLQPMINAAGADVRLRAPDGAVRATADAGRLDDILQRLIANAVEHAGAHGPIDVSLRKLGEGRARVEVRDHGPGVPTGVGEALFRPFNRFAKDAGRYGNKGVGLALARRWAELQGGSVGYDDPPGGGARFWLELPAA